MKRDDNLLEEVFELALQYDMDYYGWSQSVLAALQERLGIGNQDIFKSASTLTGGVARQGETCGALLGSMMAIGAVVGREKLEDKEQYQKAMEPAMEKRKLGIPCARKFNESGLVEVTGCISLKKEKLSTRRVAIAGRDLLKSAGLLPRLLQKSS